MMKIIFNEMYSIEFIKSITEINKEIRLFLRTFSKCLYYFD